MSVSRDRAVSLATVLLALAGGVALGGGPLQGDETRTSTEGARDESGARSQGTSVTQAKAFDEAYLRETAPALLGDRLEGRTVAVVTLPGADPKVVAEVRELVGVAGGAVTVEAEVRPELLDVANRQLVAELARQTQEAARTPVRVPDGADGYELTGRLLGHALVDGDDAGAPADATGENVLAGLTTARLLSTAEPVTRRGSLVLVVAGTPTGSADQRQGAGSIVAALTEGLEGSGDGVVLAGPAAAGDPDGVVAAVRTTRAREDVSTVDALDSPAGAVVAVRALAAEATGVTGHYGAKAPDGVLPPS